MERLQKIIANAGVCSRREAEKLILSGKVRLNNKIVHELGVKADPEKDEITVIRKKIKPQNNKIYYLVNKPIGYICTVRDKRTKKKIVDLVPKLPRVYPVGRLDKDSSGLIILTNDGDFTQKFTHPKFEHEKEYLVKVDKKITKDFLEKLRKGISMEEGIAKADKIINVNEVIFRIIIHQGWNRQIRRMVEKVGYSVVELKRTRIGKWKLGNLAVGQFRNFKK